MKYFRIVILVFFSLGLQAREPISHNELLNREDSPDYKKMRELWINEMHLTSPDINWVTIESANRSVRQEKLQSDIKNALREGKSPDEILNDEYVAQKHLRGKWIEKGSNNQAGRIKNADIDFERNLIYCASDGGNIWRGDLIGDNWQCLNNNIKFSHVRLVKILKFNGKNRIFVVANSPAMCYYSDNEGLTWDKTDGFDGPKNWGSTQKAVYVEAIDRIYVLTNEWDYKLWKQQTHLYFSDNKGESFESMYQSDVQPGLCDIWSPGGISKDLFFVHYDTLSKIDSKLEWSQVSDFNAIQNFKLMNNIQLNGSAGQNSNYMYVMINIGDGKSYFYRSSDSGTNWELKGNLSYGPFDKMSFGVSKLNPDYISFGGVEVSRSEDGGSSWTKVNGWAEYYGDVDKKLHADIPGIQYFPAPENNEIMLICTDGGIYRSDDYAKSVKNLSLKGLNVSQYYSSFTYKNSEGILFVGSQDQGFQRCLNDSGGALGFRQTISGDYGQLVSGDGGDNLWSMYPGFAMLYVDAYKENHKTYSWDLNKNNCQNWLWLPPTMANPFNPKSVFVAAGGIGCSNASNCSYIFRLTLDSNKISHTQLPYNFGWDGSRLSAMAYSEINTDHIYTLTSNGRFYHSADKGEKWDSTANFKGPDPHYFNGSSILPSKKKPGRLFIAGSGYSNCGFWVSDDHGKTFFEADSNLPATLIYKIAMSEDENFVFAATESGPYVYIVSDGRWYSMANAVSPDQTFWSVEYLNNTKTARFVTYGRGIWDFKIDEFISSVKSEEKYAEIELSTNPNILTNDVTNISFKLSLPSEIDLSIYDFEGRLIKSLFKGFASETNQSFGWDGTNQAGNQVQSGHYIAILKSNGQAKFSKINVIR